ncbi:MAG: ABC transporter ATP-binding protein, partial [Clostridia bacterium]|nr:ABC transporter ATP-binding protein [Clostridia bacterium]
MNEYFPLLLVGAIIGVFSLLFLIAYLLDAKKKDDRDLERKLSDREVMRRLLRYAKPYRKSFLAVFFILLVSIVYDIASPLLAGHIEETVKGAFELPYLFSLVAVYIGILIVSLTATYAQSMILQKTGQKILSSMRQDVFTHIESLSHDQLSKLPVGKLVTRVSNDPNAISYMFTNILVALVKSAMVLFGVLGAMLVVNYALTLMVLCFVPFIVLFTLVFRHFSRKSHRHVNDATTE